MAHMSVLGIDIAKQIFHLRGMDDSGTVVLRKRCPRRALMSFMAQMPPVVIGMEACGGAHYWARRFREYGHTVKRMAPQFVKPSVKSNQHDMADAEAIGEAVTRPTMRFVTIKEVAQQDLQALHRIRERLVKARTALIHEMRGLLGEYGIVLPKGIAQFRQALLSTLTQEQAKLTELSRNVFRQLHEEWLALEQRLAYDHAQLDAICQADPACRRLLTIPGVGPLTCGPQKRSCPRRLRINRACLSGATTRSSMARSWPLPLGSRGLVKSTSPACGRRCSAQP